MKQLFFLSGIARSGSTLLGSILNQNPSIYVSPTSPLMDIFCMTEQACREMTVQYTFDFEQVTTNIHNSLASNFYHHIDKEYIIDKHRGWPKNVDQIKRFITENPKIICTYRPIAENICSFLKLIDKDPDNSVDKELRASGLECTTYNRAMMLWFNYSKDPYESLKYGLANHRENILIVEYDNLVSTTDNELDRIYNFLDIPKFQHTYDNVSNTCNEQKDPMWGFKDLHVIRETISKTSNDPKLILGKDLCEYFTKLDNDLMLIG